MLCLATKAWIGEPMNILERAQAFVESLSEQASRGARGWQRRIHCGSRATIKNGSYRRRPWGEEGRGERRMQRHLCRHCGRSYSEQAPELVARSWYTRAAQRKVIDQCLPLGSSLRRTVAWLRSEMGKQARWRQGHPLAEGRCRLSVCTAERWLARAGLAAAESVVGQLAGIACSGEMATDGLWARLRQGAKRVVLRLADGVSGLIYPPVVAPDEERAARWEALFARAQAAGLSLAAINGLVSDGAHGLRSYLRQALPWVPQQRCVPLKFGPFAGRWKRERQSGRVRVT